MTTSRHTIVRLPRPRIIRRVRPRIQGWGNVTLVGVWGGVPDRLREAVYSGPVDLWQLPPGAEVIRTHNAVATVGAEWMAHQAGDSGSVSKIDVIKYGSGDAPAARTNTDLTTDFGDEYTAVAVIDETALSFRHILPSSEHGAGSVKELGLFSNGDGFTGYSGDDVLIARVAKALTYASGDPDDLIVLWDFATTISGSGSGQIHSAGQNWLWRRITDPTSADVPGWFVYGLGNGGAGTFVDDAILGEVARSPTGTVTFGSESTGRHHARFEGLSGEVASGDTIWQYGLAESGRPATDVLCVEVDGAGITADFATLNFRLEFDAISGYDSGLPTDEGTAIEGGDVTWSNTTNVEADDANYATCTLDAGETSYFLVLFDFDLSAATGHEPNEAPVGFIVELEIDSDGAGLRDVVVALTTTGDSTEDDIGTNHANTTDDWPTSPTARYYGGEDDDWGASITNAQAQATGFGFIIQVENTSGSTRTARIDYGRIHMYH